MEIVSTLALPDDGEGPDGPVLLAEASRDQLIDALKEKMTQVVITGFNIQGPLDDHDSVPIVAMKLDSIEVGIGLLNAAGVQFQGAMMARNVLRKVRDDHS